ncbi:MAG TPA: DUF501 domain-containing protein [Acidimicrobiales bacterium]|nr:DUF501 domain-containing protein [Acidimicrobiales bacterium]
MPRPTDRQLVTELLGRSPKGAFEVAVRHRDGTPLVIENAPLLDDGTPMPTRWWLLGEPERTWVGRLESAGGVGRAETAVDPEQLAAAHARYARARDALIPADHEGPRPFGGVGGTRRGVKCLHAHYAWWLAGGDDPVGAWVADRLAEQGYGAEVLEDEGPVAAIDCGTNSTRLLVAERGADGSLVTLDRRMHITRLGQGVDATGRLATEATDRTLGVLAEYRTVIDDVGVTSIRATATSAARDAANRDDFFGPAGALLGVEPELLSGTQEAALSFAGATAELTAEPGTYLVVDIGGGSTEFAAGVIDESGTPEIVGAESVDVGCVRITERFLTSDPPTDTELAAATAHCDRVVAGVLGRIPSARHATHLVGLAGTVSTLAAIDLGITDYDRDRTHHHVLHADRVGELTSRLLRLRAEQRRSVPGMEPGRVEVISGGLVVLASVLAATGHDRLLVSEADILDGLAASLLR